VIATFPELLTELAERGLTVRRSGADQIGLIGDGQIDDDICKSLKRFKPEFLKLLPDKRQRLVEHWQQAVDEVNGLMPAEWFGSAEQWQMLDDIEQQVQEAINASDQDKVKATCRQYVDQAKSFFMMEELFQ